MIGLQKKMFHHIALLRLGIGLSLLKMGQNLSEQRLNDSGEPGELTKPDLG
jgi:hypothetical protein